MEILSFIESDVVPINSGGGGGGAAGEGRRGGPRGEEG
jgi:hypothetical protein